MEEKIKFIDTTYMEVNGDSVDYNDKQYGIEDCILVRTTDIFPMDGVVQTPINGNAYDFGKSSILGESISKKVREKHPNYYMSEEAGEKYSSELDEFDVCFETCRRTIHFAMNGLVGSTAYGNFDGKPFVIFEPLKYHIDESLKSLRVEDVYFDNDMKLSNECSILLEENYLKQNSNNLEFLEQLKKFKVYVYRGNQQAAVCKVLSDLGYDSFLVSSNGYSNGLYDGMAASKMWRFVNNFAVENNISLDRHFYSQINYEDSINRQEKGKEIDIKHLTYILDNSTASEELKNKIVPLLYENPYYLEPLMDELVNELGLEQIKELTRQFNDLYIQELNSTKTRIK
ncbi:MAG: hypothetical protein IJE04_01085 [Bacilli bacterium]|nr:hypothetical protein [Bacilli bacterium]